MWLKKKRIFLSYSSYASKEADLIEIFFEQNGISVIRDKNVEHSFLGFMDKIEECDGVIFLLNNSFFDSVYCTYEMIIWALSGIRATPIHMSYLDIKRQEVEREQYNSFIKKTYLLSEDERKKIEDVISDYNVYSKIVNKLLNERYIEWKDNRNLEQLFSRVFYNTFKRKPKYKHIENAHEILEFHLRELENIKDETLQREFFGFLSDLVRCSFVYMSAYDEDGLGEEKLRLVDYHVNYGQIGASIRFEVIDADNVHKNIEIFDIINLERNTTDFSKRHIRYYFVIRDRRLHRDYINETKKHESLQNKEIIDKYKSLGVSRHRCTLFFQEANALETSLCDHMVVASFVEK